MSESTLRIEDLMVRAQKGDASAYASGLKQSVVLLKPYVQKWVKNAAETDDLIQEILISVHKALHTYDGTRAYRPWLLAIAKYRLSDYWRRFYADKLRHASDIAEAENIAQPPVTNSGGAYEYLAEGLKSLPIKQAEILHLLHIDGFTAKEAAQKLGMQENAVKVAAHRAYKTLRKRFEDA